MYRVGIDIGGTFTDFSVLDEQGGAVCLLFSFMNPAHEQRLRELVAEVVPDAQVYLSCETLPQIRKYPRLTTTVVNAYVAPVAGSGLKQDAIVAWRRAFDETHEKHFGSRAEDQGAAG